MSEKETWVELRGYDKYLISDSGRIVRVEENGCKYELKKHYDRDGYVRVSVAVDKKFKSRLLHRLIAETFCMKMDGCDYAYHIDRNKNNNTASNLAWGTLSDIGSRRSETLRKYPILKKGVRGTDNKSSIKVIQLDFDGNFIKEYDSLADASRETGTSVTKISQVCKGKRGTSYGYRWMYKNDYKNHGYIPKHMYSRNTMLDTISKWREKFDYFNNGELMKGDAIIARASAIYFGIKEEWVPAYGFEECYMVSSFGRVVSLDRNVDTPMGFTIFKEGRLLRYAGKADYLNVKLQDGDKKQTIKIHRLVLKSFLRDADFSMEVNHIDFDKKNNYIGNLEFCTKEKNIEHMRNAMIDARDKWAEYSTGQKVVQLSADYTFISEYDSLRMASNSTDISISSIRDCCRQHNRYSAGGFRWMYAKDYYEKHKPN